MSDHDSQTEVKKYAIENLDDFKEANQTADLLLSGKE